MSVDIAGVGFGPAMGGFLTTLSRHLLNEDGTPRLESAVSPGLPLQVICYERADGLGFGVSGTVTRARGIRASFPGVDLFQIPMAVPVAEEKLVYLLDPIGASRRSFVFRVKDRMIRALGSFARLRDDAVELPFTPRFMRKHDGLVLSLGQFNQWVSEQVTSSGLVQLWPGMPVSEPLIEADTVSGIRLADQGVNLDGSASGGFMPGMDIRAALTVVADGPVGAVGRAIDSHFGRPPEHDRQEWALGMKMVVELREDCALKPGTVLHTFGFPEPEIFGFLLRASRSARVRGHLHSLLVPQPRAHGLSISAALHASSLSMASSARRNAAIVGREVTAGIRPPRRAIPGGQRIRTHRRRLWEHECSRRIGCG